MMLFPQEGDPQQDIQDLSTFVTGGVPESAYVRDRSGKDPWTKLDEAALQKRIAPDLGMPYGTTTPQEAQYTERATADAARDWYTPQTAWGAGLMAAGSSLPLPPPVRMGALATGFALSSSEAEAIPAGRRSQTANLRALDAAQDMYRGGKSNDEIRNATGWYRSGADGGWRYTISDKESKWLVDPREIQGPVRMGDVYHHPEAYAAYPELAKAELNVRSIPGARGSYQSGMGVDVPTVTLSPSKPDMMRSVNLHEMTHGVQDIEDFAQGGSTWGGLRRGTPEWKFYQERIKAIQTPMSKQEFDDLGIGGEGFTHKEYLKQHKDALKDPDKWRVIDRMAQETAVRQGYDLSAGENEARVTQKMADMTPEQIAFPKNAPWRLQDTPYDKQVVKFRQKMGGLAEPSYAVDPKLWSPISNTKLEKPISEMEHGITVHRTPTPKIIDPAKLQGGVGYFTPSDLSIGNATVNKIDTIPLERPVRAHGGVSFPEANPGLGWASSGSIATKMDNQLGAIAEMGKPTYIIPMTMSPSSAIDASQHVSDPLSQLVKGAPIAKTNIEKFDRMMRREMGKKAGKDWPGVTHEDFPDYINSPETSMKVRSLMADRMALSEWRDKGFPNVGAVRHAMSEPGLIDAPRYTTGMTVSRYEPGKGVLPTSHPDYSGGIAGQHMGQLASLTPYHVMAPTIDAGLTRHNNWLADTGRKTEVNPRYHAEKKIKNVPLYQEFNQEWLDRMMEWERLMARARGQ